MTEANSNIGPAHQNLQENDNKIASLIESVKKLSILINGKDTEVVCDSGSECPIITYDIAKKLGLEINKSLPEITDKVVSDIVKQVSGKKIWISLRQEIINSIVNQGISQHQHIPCIAKRKKPIFSTPGTCSANDTASSSSSSSSESGSDSESSNDNKDYN